MENVDLAKYIADCRAQGGTDSEIRQLLVTGGWDPSMVDSALTQVAPAAPPILPASSGQPSGINSDLTISAAPAEPFQKKSSPWKRLLYGSGLFLCLVIFLAAVAITWAEQGYAPALSRLYRRTELPFLWKGTNGSPSLTALKMYQSLLITPNTGASLTITLNLKKIREDQPTLFSRSTMYAPLAKLTDDSGRALASVGSTVGSVPIPGNSAVFQPDKLFPLTIGITTTSSTDSNRNAAGSAELDLTGLDKIFFPTDTPTAPSKLNGEYKLVMADKKVYFRSNALPYYLAADIGKWFSYPLSNSTITNLNNPKQSANQLSNRDRTELEDLASSLITDQGIIRDGGHPYALYHLHLDQAVLKKMADNPKLKQYREDILSAATADTPVLDLDFELDPRSALLHSMKGTLTSISNEANLRGTANISLGVSYGAAPAITAPPLDQQLIKSNSDYQSQFATFYTNWLTGKQKSNDPTWFGNSRIGLGIKDMVGSELTQANDNAKLDQQKSDVTELGKALVIYQDQDQSFGQVPSTGGVLQNLGDPTCILRTDPRFTSIFQLSGSGSPYSYISDGTHYVISTDLPATDGQPAIRFVVRDGTARNEPADTPLTLLAPQ